MDRYVNALRVARNDTEKLAALFVLARTTDAGQMSPECRREVFDAVGFEFLHRLLRTDVPEGCDDNAFKSLAVSVLASFCTDPELAVRPELLRELDILKHVVESGSSRQMARDALCCVAAAASHHDGAQHVLNIGLVPCLVEAYASGTDEALAVLVCLSASLGDNAWVSSSDAFARLMETLSSQFKSAQSARKVELCGTLADVLADKSLVAADLPSRWMANVRDGLADVLLREGSEEARVAALRLAGLLMGKFDILDLLEHADGARKFVTVLVHLACIEIRIILERESIPGIVHRAASLSVCYTILECAVAMMSDETAWCAADAQTEKLLLAITDAFKAIIGFIKTFSEEWQTWTSQESSVQKEAKELTYATIRVLCAWLAEETGQLRQEVCSILPFVFVVASRSVLGDQPEGDPDVDLMRFLLAPLCHLTADDASRAVLISANAHVLLYQYLELRWMLFLQTYSADVESSLSTICGIFLNIVVLEGKLVAENEVFFALLKFLFCASHQISSRPNYLLLKGNFAVLGLLTARHHHKKIKSCETFFYKYLSASIKFLWDAYHVDSADVPSLVLARDYESLWSDLMELWFLGMQALANLLNAMPWVAGFLLESGWPRLVIISLAQVEERGVEGNVKSAFQDFLCCVTRSCKDAVPALLECGATEVCKLHKMKDLEALLMQ